MIRSEAFQYYNFVLVKIVEEKQNKNQYLCSIVYLNITYVDLN